MSELPIQAVLPELADALRTHTRVVLEAPPGAGKTTAVPLALRAAPWLAGQRMLLLEPRRIAARSAAVWMAAQLGEPVGETVGYRIRFEARVSSRTRIEIVTEGILTRLLQDDPTLEGVGLLIFDEFHERHLHGDLALALALDAQAGLREDLRLLVMSATLEGERLATWLDAARVRSAGRSFPVDLQYAPPRREESIELALTRAVQQTLPATTGSMLCFLPGKREIERARGLLEGALGEAPADRRIEVLPLHGELPIEEQVRAVRPGPAGQRRVILATNVAESALTVPDVRVVIDSGLAREPRFDPGAGFSRLVTTRIAQSSATQRAGRAGRLAPGTCVRLWASDQRLEAQTRPEILHADLAGLALELAAWGSAALPFPDPPPPGPLAQARELLRALGALAEDHTITARGRRLLQSGVHPRLGAMIDGAYGAPERARVALLLALLDQRDVLHGEAAREVDWWPRVQLAQRAPGGPLRATLGQWRRRMRVEEHASPFAQPHEVGDLLALAFPDRIARLQSGSRYQLANGRGARLFDDASLRGQPWLVVSDLDGEGADARIRRAAALDPEVLQRHWPQRFTHARQLRFDADSRAVLASEEQRFDRLVLTSRVVPAGAGTETTAALLSGIRALGLDALPFAESACEWRLRTLALKDWLPDLDLPAVDDAALLDRLEDWLGPFIEGRTRLAQLDPQTLDQALRSLYSHTQRQSVETQAPVRLTVPSGMERRLDYAPGQPPVLAVKLQELFGLADTPRIAQGRVPVLLHLLSPAGRPIQVTQDLRGFWDRTYPEVKKELKGRYPRHPWPDDPWSAQPTARAKPRGT